jgi:predicted MFS family arabinose efflux permease
VIAIALIMTPWGLGGFASNSAQQARLGLAAPQLATALMALNTSAIYLGQAIGAAGGGAVVAAHAALGHTGKALYASLHWIALAWALLAIALSVWAQRQMSKPDGRT